MNRKSFTGVAFLIMFFLLISCNTKIQENRDTVSVSGIGTVFAQPDMVLMNISFYHTAPTTKAAKNAVEEIMRRILQILQEENIEDKFIKTVSLNYDVEHEWRNERMVLIGQRAQQTIVVTVNDMINRPERFPALLDKISAINRVEVDNIRFDIENKTELFKQSRELAYQKAYDKAVQYAEISGRKIEKAITISEVVSRDIAQARAFTSNAAFREQAEYSDLVVGSVAVPTGESGVTSEINITFSLK